jgi:hypothetical protein
VIVDGIRRAAIATFPPGTPLLVIAPGAAGYDGILGDRNDAAIAFQALEALAPGGSTLPAATPHVFIEGLDALDDPAALLRSIGANMPEARLFALVANAAHVGSLSAFFSGIPLARAHPLVLLEIEPLLASSGWRTLATRAVTDDVLPAPAARPPILALGSIGFEIGEPAHYELVRTAAYFVIADRQ